jgi:hypothetical protein
MYSLLLIVVVPFGPIGAIVGHGLLGYDLRARGFSVL